MSFNEIVVPLEKTLNYLFNCSDPRKYLSDGELTLNNFYTLIYWGNLKYHYKEVGIEQIEAIKMREHLKTDLFKKKSSSSFIYKLYSNFKDYFVIDEHSKKLIREVNEEREKRGLELIILD